MTANTSCVFLDSSEFDPSWFQGGWSNSSHGYFVGGSAMVTNGSGKLSFVNLDGTGLVVNGFVPAIDKAWTVDVDGFTVYPKFPNPPNSSWWGAWMSDHTTSVASVKNVLVAGMPEGVVVDFITLYPPFSSSIRGKKIIVDDTDQLLEYTGSWLEKGGKFDETEIQYHLDDADPEGQLGVPYSGGVTQSSQVGDMIRFPFTGTYVSVYGPLSVINRSGNVTVAFSIDNKNMTTATFPISARGNYTNYLPFTTVLSYNFFSSPLLDVGDHILTIQIMEAFEGFSFMLDFIIYTAAFDSLDAMPKIHVPSSTSTSLTLPSSPTTLPSSLVPTKPNVSAMAGGVVGGVISLIIVTIGALYLFRRWRRQAALDKLSAYPFIDFVLESEKAVHNGPSHPDDFTTMFWNEATGATMVTSTPAKSPPQQVARSISEVAPLPLGAASPEQAPGRSALDATQRVQELERQVQELTGEVQELTGEVQLLRPPEYSDGQHVGTS